MPDTITIIASIAILNIALYALVWKGVTDRIDAVDPDPILLPAGDPDDWGHDVYIVDVVYNDDVEYLTALRREQTLVVVDTDSDIDQQGDHADGPTPYRLKAYIEDTIDDATVKDIQHVQAYQVADGLDDDTEQPADTSP